MMIAVIPAGWGPAITVGGETAWFDTNVSVSFLRRDSLVGWLTWRAVNRINLIALAVVGGCMKETFCLCCQHLIPNDYHIPLNWCWTKHAWGLATTLPKIVSAIWSWQTRALKRKQAFQLKPVRTSPRQACYFSCSWTVSFFIHAPVVKVLLCIICRWIILKAMTVCCWWSLFPLEDGYLH